MRSNGRAKPVGILDNQNSPRRYTRGSITARNMAADQTRERKPQY
jgi:hypothetical protein